MAEAPLGKEGLDAEKGGLIEEASAPASAARPEGVELDMNPAAEDGHGHGHDGHGHGHGHGDGGCLDKCVHSTPIQKIQQYSLPLMLGVVLAMVMANVGEKPWEPYHTLFHGQFFEWSVMGHPITFHFIINDVFMAFFFGIAGKEITEACLPGGSLNPPAKAANPLFATLGGVAGPVGFYLIVGQWLEFGTPESKDFCAPLSGGDGGHRRLASSGPVDHGSDCVFGKAWEDIWGRDECEDATAYCTAWVADHDFAIAIGNSTNSTAADYVIQPYAWQTIAHGWGIPTATDISLAWMVANQIFGAGRESAPTAPRRPPRARPPALGSHTALRADPAISFLLLLAVADDGLGLIIIAIFYPNPNHAFHGEWLLSTLGGMLLALFMRRYCYGHPRWNWLGGNWIWYILGPGVLSWFGLVGAALHPALALVPIVPFLPAGPPPSHGEEAHAAPEPEPEPEGLPAETPKASEADQSHREHQRRHAHEVFDRMDSDGDQTLAPDEVEAYLKELGEQDLTMAVARFQTDIADHLDKETGDAEAVKFEEFFSWFTTTGGYEVNIIKNALQEHELFAGMNPIQIEKLAKHISINSDDHNYAAGDVIVHAGTKGSDMYIVHQGSAAAYTASEGEEDAAAYSNRVKTYAAKGVFGELGLLHAIATNETTTRQATVKATSDETQVWKLGRTELSLCSPEVMLQIGAMADAYEGVMKGEHEAEEHFHDAPLHKFEHQSKLTVDFGMLFFAWANAGVTVEGTGSMTWLILLSLMVGKLIGITVMSLFAEAIGFPRSDAVGVKEVLVVSVVASIGLTVALFVTGEAFQADAGLMRDAKFGCLLSIVAGPAAFAMGKVLGVGGKVRPQLTLATIVVPLAGQV